MKKFEEEIKEFIEPIYRFCLKRVNNRYDAEDLASEIILHILDGIDKYEIKSLEAWVWRIAHNRYARFCEAKKNKTEICFDEFPVDLENDYCSIDNAVVINEYKVVFRYLHTLSSEYRDILVDFYIGDMSVKRLAEKYSLPETTIKWRLNASRQKIRKRIGLYSGGENNMDKIYKRINWESTSCNGSMNAGAYLSNQVARAICEAAYEKPVNVEEISLKTGIPTLYIEDTMPHLIYGDAIEKIGNKYATSFIILRINEKIQMEKQFSPLINKIADEFEKLFTGCSRKIETMCFYGNNFGMSRLGYIAVPLALRSKIKSIKECMPELANGPFPPRKDGGYGWFIVEEAANENDRGGEYDSGCNITDGDSDYIYYYHIGKYFCGGIYNNGGTRWLADNKIPQKCKNGLIPSGLLSEEDIIRLMQVNLISKTKEGYKINFACFTQEQFIEFSDMFRLDDREIERLLNDLILNISRNFRTFVPKRLDNQINQWVSCFLNSISGYVTEELITRGILEKPDEEKPLTNGVFYIGGKNINV